MEPIRFVYPGRIPSMKNSRVPIKVKKRIIFKKNAKVEEAMETLAALAQEEVNRVWDGILPDRTPFKLRIEAYVDRWTAPDLDGMINTVLDALQDVVYPNDRYCSQIEAYKVVVPSTAYEVCVIQVVPVESLQYEVCRKTYIGEIAHSIYNIESVNPGQFPKEDMFVDSEGRSFIRFLSQEDAMSFILKYGYATDVDDIRSKVIYIDWVD